MKIAKKALGRYFQLITGKYREAYGISSKKKGWEEKKHHLLIDSDRLGRERVEFQLAIHEFYKTFPHLVYDTEHGSHAIIDIHLTFEDVVKSLISLPWVDLTWLAQGIKRGYWFLEYKGAEFPKMFDQIDDFEYMMIERRVDKDEGDTGLLR